MATDITTRTHSDTLREVVHKGMRSGEMQMSVTVVLLFNQVSRNLFCKNLSRVSLVRKKGFIRGHFKPQIGPNQENEPRNKRKRESKVVLLRTSRSRNPHLKGDERERSRNPI